MLCPYKSSLTDSNTEMLKTIISQICAAVSTGTLGAVLSNPMDVIKVRQMALASSSMSSSLVGTFARISREEGLAGFMRGVLPSTLRGACIAAGELATYDHAKGMIKLLLWRNGGSQNGMKSNEEGLTLHIAASLVTGIVAATVAAPFDLFKTRAMNESAITASKTCISVGSIVESEGLKVLFRGWLPSYLRLGPHALICFPLFEQIRKLMGLSYL